jgi:hypothetical protein
VEPLSNQANNQPNVKKDENSDEEVVDGDKPGKKQ